MGTSTFHGIAMSGTLKGEFAVSAKTENSMVTDKYSEFKVLKPFDVVMEGSMLS